MGLVRGDEVRSPALEYKPQRSVFEKGDNLLVPPQSMRAAEALTHWQGNGGAPFTDMTWTRTLLYSHTFTARCIVHSAQLACSWDSAAGGYRMAVEISLGDIVMHVPAAGDNAGANACSVPLGIVVEAGTIVEFVAYFRLTAAAYWLNASLSFTPV